MKTSFLCAAILAVSFPNFANSQIVLSDPAITNAATAFSGAFVASNVFDNNTATEYASEGFGNNTFIDFAFSLPTLINGFDMTQRNSSARVRTSSLIFDDNSDFSSPIISVPLTHTNSPLAYDFFSFTGVTAQYVRWDVQTNTGPGIGAADNGAAEMNFYTAPEPSSVILLLSGAALCLRRRSLRTHERNA